MSNRPLLIMGTGAFFPPAAYVVSDGELSGESTFTRASSATYFDGNGILQTATTNVARNHYPQNGTGLNGLYIEEARTNVCIESETFDLWSMQNTTVTTDQAVAPDGTTTMDEIDAGTGTGEHHVEQSGFTISSGTTAVMSVYARAGTEDTIRFWNNRAGGFCTFDMTAITATGSGTITDLGGGLFYCSCPSTPAGGDWTQSRVYVKQSTSYTGANETVFLWGAQIEAGAFPTSYIATTTISVTRAADFASVDLTAVSWFNSVEGTIYDDFDRDDLVTGQFTHAVNINDATGNEQLRILQANGTNSNLTCDIIDGGVNQFTATIADASINTRKKAALAWKLNDSAFAVDGASPTTDAACTIPTVTQINIGSSNSGNHLNGIILNMRYYNTRLIDATLQSLTT